MHTCMSLCLPEGPYWHSLCPGARASEVGAHLWGRRYARESIDKTPCLQVPSLEIRWCFPSTTCGVTPAGKAATQSTDEGTQEAARLRAALAPQAQELAELRQQAVELERGFHFTKWTVSPEDLADVLDSMQCKARECCPERTFRTSPPRNLATASRCVQTQALHA